MTIIPDFQISIRNIRYKIINRFQSTTQRNDFIRHEMMGISLLYYLTDLALFAVQLQYCMFDNCIYPRHGRHATGSDARVTHSTLISINNMALLQPLTLYQVLSNTMPCLLDTNITKKVTGNHPTVLLLINNANIAHSHRTRM